MGNASGCGSAGGTTATYLTLTGQNISGLALAPGSAFSIGGNDSTGPTFIEDSVGLPEPGTWLLAITGLFIAVMATMATRRHRLARTGNR
jgi:hypothetical protein